MNGDKRTRCHTVWVEDDLDHWIHVSAMQNCMEVSSYIRSILRREMDSTPVNYVDHAEIRAELAKIMERLR